MAKDLYLILRVSREATPEQIHAAYRRRALELHPDTSGADGEPFIELQEAYSILSNPAQRAAYDRDTRPVSARRRSNLGSRRPSPEPFREVHPASRFREFSLASSFETFSPSFEDVFERLWGNFDLLARPKAEGLENLSVDILLSADEAFAGGSARILVPTRVQCGTCCGHGGLGPYECWRCRGQGVVSVEFPLEIPYPAELRRDYVVKVPLEGFGIRNFYLTARFRPVGPA